MAVVSLIFLLIVSLKAIKQLSLGLHSRFAFFVECEQVMLFSPEQSQTMILS